VCKSADLLLMVLDASKPHGHREILTAELEAVGVRLNRRPPSIYFKKKKTGGISFSATLPLTRMDEKLCHRILQARRACRRARVGPVVRVLLGSLGAAARDAVPISV
jgi:ribosome-interacting GTPase 1